ncbi:hypothetical protein C8Q80DRAFT_1215127 [Daedaleopsis nitida]|nr:hypothetical protein C8Q80DRAFT_1215127 [Daedaleopsis nitida]
MVSAVASALLTDLSCVLCCCPRRCLLLGVELFASEVGLRLPFAVGWITGDWAKSAPNAPGAMQVLTLPGIWTVIWTVDCNLDGGL